MSTTSGVNVLRYSALAFGIFYGFTHQRSINAQQRVAAAQREYDHKKKLIQEAKAKFAAQKNPVKSSEKSGLNQDPMDPNFDLETFFNALMEQK